MMVTAVVVETAAAGAKAAAGVAELEKYAKTEKS